MNNLEKYINIKIKYSDDFEVQRVFKSLQKINWYKKMGYNLVLPKALSSKNLGALSDKSIKQIVKKIYGVLDYQKISNSIEQKWPKISTKVFNALPMFNLPSKKQYNVILTKYGVAGSYNLPNTIIVNFSNKTNNEIIKIIVHEMIHLIIEPLILKHKTGHWQKERIVDLIVSKVNPLNDRMQNLPIRTEKIDKIFSNFYPDIEKIIKSINK